MLRRDKKKTKKILSDKIADLLTVAPTADVEDDHVFGTKPKTVTREDLDSDEDHVEEADLSSFRKQNASLLADLSDRYAGEITSKKDLGFDGEIDDSDSDSVEVDSDDLANDSDEQLVEDKTDDKSVSLDEEDDQSIDEEEEDVDKDGSNMEGSDEGGSDDESDVEESDEGFNLSEMNVDTQREEEFKHFKPKDVSEDVAKGCCVKNQLNIWESLLEMRISMQKCLGTANRMPLQENFKLMKKEGGDEFNILANKTKGSAVTLLSRLLALQDAVVSQFSETKNLFNKNKPAEDDGVVEDPMDEEIPSDEEITSDEDNEEMKVEKPKENIPIKTNKRKRKLADYSTELAERHNTYSNYRNSVIQKWNDKTKVMGQKKDQPPAISVLSQIDYILGDKNKLIRRTQLKKSKFDILGETKEEECERADDQENPEGVDRRHLDEEYCSEIFDDDDFYHQLLRELIEHKSADISDPIQLSRQWIMLQQIRSKMKRKIDTRATKGRRIRYAVHSKLVNYMAPEVSHDWTHEMKDELYASLFGKQFENNTENGKNN